MSVQNYSTLSETDKVIDPENFHMSFELAMKRTFEILGEEHSNLINAKSSKSNGGVFEDISPWNTDVNVGYFQDSAEADIEAAAVAANSAFRDWSRVDPSERAAIFQKAADLIAERRYSIAALIAIESGKTRYAAATEVDSSISTLRNYLAVVLRNPGEHNKPIGTWGVITPSVAPFSCPTSLVSASAINGNTVILKPSSETPFAALFLCNILHEAGLPPGVLNHVTGRGRKVGPAMALNSKIGAIAFAGSFKEAKGFLRWYDIPRFVGVIGGNNAAIVTANADLKKAAEDIITSAFGSCGRDCSAVKRVYIEEAVKDEFTSLLIDKASKLRTEDPLNRETTLGVLINEDAFNDYAWKIEIAAMDGTILTGGHRLNSAGRLSGYYVEPAIVDSLKPEHDFFQKELPYPILCLARFSSFQDGIRMANNTRFGFAAAIYSSEKKEVDQLVSSRDQSIYTINECLGHMPTGCRFSLFKRSTHGGPAPEEISRPDFLSMFREQQEPG